MSEISRVINLFERFVEAFERAVVVLEQYVLRESEEPDEGIVDWRGVRDYLGLTASSAAVINRKVREGRLPRPDALPGPRGKQRWYRETLKRYVNEMRKGQSPGTAA